MSFSELRLTSWRSFATVRRMSPWFFVFLLGVACAEILGRVMRHVAPRRGAPSPAIALRLLHERERALTQRELEWTHWASYVASPRNRRSWYCRRCQARPRRMQLARRAAWSRVLDELSPHDAFGPAH
jgi:hypothetical protein